MSNGNLIPFLLRHLEVHPSNNCGRKSKRKKTRRKRRETKKNLGKEDEANPSTKHFLVENGFVPTLFKLFPFSSFWNRYIH